MPRKRKEKVYKSYTDEAFQKAVNAVRGGRLSQRKASFLFKIPQATLSDHLRGKVEDGASARLKPVIPLEVEKQIVEKCSKAAEMGLRMTKTQVMEKVVASKSSRTIPGRVSDTKERNTIFGTINAVGDHMPPLVIVKGKTQKAVMSWNTADGPEGTN